MSLELKTERWAEVSQAECIGGKTPSQMEQHVQGQEVWKILVKVQLEGAG